MSCPSVYFYIGNELCLNVFVVVIPAIAVAGATVAVLVCCLKRGCPWYHCCNRSSHRQTHDHDNEKL